MSKLIECSECDGGKIKCPECKGDLETERRGRLMAKKPKDWTGISYPIGEFIMDELKARRWTVEMLAGAMGCETKQLEAIIEGKRELNQAYARMLGKAFGTSWQMWSRLAKQAKGE